MDIAASLRFSKTAVHNDIVKFNGDGMLQDKVRKKKEMFYLTTHSTHFIYGYMASDILL